MSQEKKIEKYGEQNSEIVATIIGTGYVGLGYAAGFTSHGIKTNCIDLNPNIVKKIQEGKSPIDEPGMEESIKNGLDNKLLSASTNISKFHKKTDAYFICVGTYCDEEGNIDLSQIRSAATDIGKILNSDSKYRVICVKSTVIPGTTDKIVKKILEKESGKKAGKDFGLCMSPEFLREGNALEDITHPDKIVIGGIDKKSIKFLRKFFEPIHIKSNAPIIETDLRTAEMIKYAQNSFLAMKISFINEMANLAEKFGVNIGDVSNALGLDKRISPMFLNAGAGFGGSCFPKDVLALLKAGQKAGYEPLLLKSTLEVNKRQKYHVIELLESLTEIEGKKIAILGLAFKPNTGDTREAVSYTVINALLKKKAKSITVHDPSEFAMDEIRNYYGDSINYGSSITDTIENKEICIILTEWDVYKRLKPEIFLEEMNENPILIDGRRIFDENEFKNAGILIKVIGQSSDKSFHPE